MRRWYLRLRGWICGQPGSLPLDWVHLQDKSGEAEETGKTGTGDLGGAGGDDGRLAGGGRDRGTSGGGVVAAGVADNDRRGGDRASDGARAVGDGEGGRLGDGVGLVGVDNGGRDRAVGGQGSDDLGDVGHVLGSGSNASEGNNGSGELHFDGG